MVQAVSVLVTTIAGDVQDDADIASFGREVNTNVTRNVVYAVEGGLRAKKRPVPLKKVPTV